jgi:hypothetical protein
MPDFPNRRQILAAAEVTTLTFEASKRAKLSGEITP